MAGCCENCNEPCGSINGGEFCNKYETVAREEGLLRMDIQFAVGDRVAALYSTCFIFYCCMRCFLHRDDECCMTSICKPTHYLFFF